ncbi:MAG: exonuclease SbcCD subunit D [Candidatus Lokiarchaeota archaeon]|nr:exonuclease SbcCD subunit D [Candidatus Lokiarchaeota archaeon]
MLEKIKFIHAADIHLGHKQYGSEERFRDFNRAFDRVLEIALSEQVDFVLIAGDLFNDNEVLPETMVNVYSSLADFHKKAGHKIPVIAIEGNHDTKSYGMLRSWMQFLAELDQIVLLDGRWGEKGGLTFEDYDPKRHRGGRIQIKDTFVYGMRYHVGDMNVIYQRIKDAIPPGAFNILAMHFGIQGEVANETGVSYGPGLASLKEVVDYLALGHFHKQYQLHDWIHNPGSTEANEAPEYEYPHGIFVVTVEGKGPAGIHVTPVAVPGRRFVNQPLDVGQSNLDTWHATKALITGTVAARLVRRDPAKPADPSNLNVPVVNITLHGTISYSRTEMDVKGLEADITRDYEVLKVRITNNVTEKAEGLIVDPNQALSLKELEKQAFEKIVENEPSFAGQARAISSLMAEIKTAMLAATSSPVDTADQLRKWWVGNRAQVKGGRRP